MIFILVHMYTKYNYVFKKQFEIFDKICCYAQAAVILVVPKINWVQLVLSLNLKKF